MGEIKKDSDAPYYRQLADLLREDIDAHSVGPNVHSLPSEHELCATYHVTRTTVRHALDILEREGKIIRQRGKRRRAAVPRVEQDLTRLVSTTEDMRQRGWQLVTRVISVAQIKPPPVVRQNLELGPGQEVYRLVRLRITDDLPLSVQTSFVPTHLCPDLDKNDLASSLYDLFEKKYGLLLWSGRQTVSARGATQVESQLLEIRPGTPLLHAERVTYAATGQPVEYLEAVWVGDRYDFTTTLTRPV
jgi:GntR family transcriptional regulator, N-acetylglucosamine utilization regulator